MLHPNEEVLRAAYAAFQRGDIQGFLARCTPDIRFHLRGDNALAGEYDRASFPALLGRFGEIAGDSLRVQVVDVLADDSRGVVFLDDLLTRADNGQTYRLELVHSFQFRDGKLATFEELPLDQRTYDAAWAPRGEARPAPNDEVPPVFSIH